MAQIVTITNPLTGQPAQVDQLDHTAQEIDDAIARALPGGGIDTLLAGKAPAGYGYGDTVSIYVGTSETIADRFDALLADMPTYSAKQVFVKDPAFSTIWFCGTLKKFNSSNDAAFDGWSVYGVESVHKTKSDGTWWDWQYTNPFIFSPGKVYPLTEASLYRCLWTISIYCGAASNGKEVKVEVPGINSIVRYAAWDDGGKSGAPYDPSLFKIEKAPATDSFSGGIKITMTATTGSPWVQVWFDKS